MDLNVLVLPGDGIGTEVTRQAVRVLRHVAGKWNHQPKLTEGLLGGIAWALWSKDAAGRFHDTAGKQGPDRWSQAPGGIPAWQPGGARVGRLGSRQAIDLRSRERGRERR